MQKTISLMIIVMFIALPIISAQELSIGNIKPKVIDDSTAIINWTTNIDSTSKVNYGTENLDESQTESTPKTQHSIKLDNLEEETEYNFEVVSEADGKSEKSTTLIFKTLPKVEIGDIKVSTTVNSATINFSTNIEINTHVIYGEEVTKKDKQTIVSQNKKKHSIEITGLEENKEYFFQIISDYKNSDEGGFKTKTFSENVLKVELPTYYNELSINIQGTASIDGYVLLNINDENNKRYTSSGTGPNGEFKFSNVKLLNNQKNELKFEVTDSAGLKKEYVYYITVDTKVPNLKITQEPPNTALEEGNIEIKGFVDENVTMLYTVSTLKPEEITKVIDAPVVIEHKEGRVTIQWNKTKYPEFKYYKVYRNGELFITSSTTRITDGFIGKNKAYKYQISMVDTNCKEGPLSEELLYVNTEGNTEEQQFPKPMEDCEVSYQFDPETINGNFEKILPIEEGINYITIIARDSAGNENKKEYTVLKDTQPPTITEISPEEATGSGFFIYEGTIGTRVTIKGKTDPFSKVQMLIEGKEHTTVDADAEGYFKFEDVNIEQLAKGAHDNFYLPVDPKDVVVEKTLDREDEFDVEIVLVATDTVGLKSDEEELRFTIGTCWSGQMKFDIRPLSKYQMPTMLSPDRIEEGSEQISFILELNYSGDSTEWYVEDVEITPRCKATRFKEDSKYNLSCKLLAEGQPILKKSNPKKTLWYFTFSMNKMEEISKMTGLTTKDFMKAMQGEIRFPFDVVVQYRETDKDEISKHQKKCMEVSYLLDNSRIDPREVMPEWLLEGGIDLTNQTMNTLDKIIPQVKQALKITAFATAAGFIAKIGARTFRKGACRAEAYMPDSECPKPGSSGQKRTGWSMLSASEIKEKKYLQDDLTDEELEEYCTSCAAAWKEETEMNKLLRWAGDRFLCHKTPAKWTENAEPKTVQKSIENTMECYNNEKITRKGIWVKRIPQAPDPNPEKHNMYFEFDGAQYVVDGTLPESKIKLRRVNAGDAPITEKEIVASWIQGKAFMEFKDIPKYYKDKLSLTEESKLEVVEDSIAKSQCPDLVNKKTYKRDSEVLGIKEFSYRENLLKMTCYNENVYFKNRDETACFGQNNALYKEKLPLLTPQQHTSTFQCLCVSGIYNRLKALRNIMAGLNNCLNQIKTTGKADAGVCKEIFTQYMCDALWQVVSYFSDDCAPVDPTKGGSVDGGVEGIKNAISNAFSSIDETSAEFTEDYGNAKLNEYLGAGTQGIMKKVCLGALTGDWGLDFENIIDASYSSSFNSYANAWPAKREYLGYDPSSDKARYEYRVAWNIAPGCNIDSYSVKLACINQRTASEYGVDRGLSCEKSLTAGETHPFRGCDCWELPETEEAFFAPGDRLTQGQFEDSSHSRVVEAALFRYDHVKIQLNIFDQKQRETCLPEGHKDGIWYFPIEDKTAHDIIGCSFNPISGTFGCEGTELLWDARGNAYFVGEIELPLPPEKRIYNPGDELKFKVQIFNKNWKKPQCLVVEMQNQNGASIPQFKPWYIKVNKNGTAWYEQTLLKQLDVAGEQFRIQTQYPNYGSLQYQGRSNTNYVQFTLGFIDNDGDKKITANDKDTYIVYDENNRPLGGPKRVTEFITEKDVQLKPVAIGMPVKVDSNNNEVYLNQHNFTIYAESVKASTEVKDWIVHMELRHMKEGSDDCTQTDEKDRLTSDTYDWQKDVHIRIQPKGIPSTEQDRCVNSRQTPSSKPCICGAATEINCGKSDVGMYCYAIADDVEKCHSNALCPRNVGIDMPCACADKTIADGVVFGPGFCDNTQNRFCCELISGKVGCVSSLNDCKTTTAPVIPTPTQPVNPVIPGTPTTIRRFHDGHWFDDDPTLQKSAILINSVYNEFKTQIQEASSKYGVDKCMILGIMISETNGKLGTISESGYNGIMQSYGSKEYKTEIADGIAPTALEQIKHGTNKIKIFDSTLQNAIPGFANFKDRWRYVTASYNAGPGVIINTYNRVFKGQGDIPWSSIRDNLNVEDFKNTKDIAYTTQVKYYKDYLGDRWNNLNEYLQFKIDREVIRHNVRTYSALKYCENNYKN